MSTCVDDTSNEKCENGEHIQDVDSVCAIAVAMKISLTPSLYTDVKKNALSKNKREYLLD